VLNSGLAGISFAGADICGFMKVRAPLACARSPVTPVQHPAPREAQGPRARKQLGLARAGLQPSRVRCTLGE